MAATTSKSRHSHTANYNIANDLEKIRNAFSDTALDLRDKTGEILSQSFDDIKDGIKEKSNQTREGVARYTVKNPFKSLGVVLLTGIAMGYFLRRRY